MKLRIMNYELRIAFLLVGLLALSLTANAQLNSPTQQNVIGEAGTFLIRNARIVTVTGATIENGSVLIQNGKIAAVGANVPSAGDAQTIDGSGLTVFPGMIDAGTNMGLMEIPLGAPGTDDDAEVGEMNPNARAIVAVQPHSTHIPVTRVNGVTSAQTFPNGGVIAGQSAVINLIGSTQAEMSVNPAFALVINFPRVSTFGGFGGGGQTFDFNEALRTRDRRLDELRKMLKDAETYGKVQDAYAQNKSVPRPSTDLKLAALVPYVRGERPVIFNADRETDIRNAVRFADEMKLKAIILGGNEAWKAANVLKEKNVPVILTGMWSLPARDDDYYDVLFENASKLQKAGVRFCVATGDSGANVRDLPYQAGMAAAFGLTPEEALKSVTIYPAQILGVERQLGSIETGKTANIVVATGDILDPRTKIVHLFINGRKLPLTSRHTELYDQFKNRPLSPR
ncbi:MAG TPA: amidohydrolase family protein [Pyrinomonadaceae bacterium]|nr:amidohydrolase family protein [Pyrinomonadaceae bacterium]